MKPLTYDRCPLTGNINVITLQFSRQREAPFR